MDPHPRLASYFPPVCAITARVGLYSPGGLSVPDTGQEAAAVRRVSWRRLPLLFAAYFVAYIDRVNVGFAALTMNQDLGLNAEQYGLAAALFFVGYVAFSI